MPRTTLPAVFVGATLITVAPQPAPAQVPLERIVVSPSHRFLATASGAPFFWLADTGWLLFQKLDRAEAIRYLDNRRAKGFNVVQAMVLHSGRDHLLSGAPALINGDPAHPNVTPGADPARPEEYDYWDHVDWVIDRAAEREIYLALVPAWGALVKTRILNPGNVREYARFLAERYRAKPNLFWITGGDVRGDQNIEVWRALGATLREFDPDHLITYHPFGRTQSATWFHNEPWLDFNMFQSGHRRYDQGAQRDDERVQAAAMPNEPNFGEDNWRYIAADYALDPPKPTLDAEPSYEGIPQGLHDTTQPYWTDRDARRYAWWSVFAGACGHTYGNNAVMQMHKPGVGEGSFGPRSYWDQAIDDPGAGQMQFLKRLMLSRPYFERVPDQELVAAGSGPRYDYVAATRGAAYAMFYDYSGHPFEVRMGRISGRKVRAWWYNPRDGRATPAGQFANRGTRRFVPPGTPAPGNDWVLVLDDAAAKSTEPGK